MTTQFPSNRKNTKADRFQNVEKQVEALTMATRIGQMMAQRTLQQMEGLAANTATNTGMLNDFQYRLLALQQMLGVDVVKLQAIADEMKLADFDRESVRKDFEGHFEVVESVETDADTIILTSSTPEEKEDRGILRSRMKIADMNQPDFAAQLVGKKVGDKVEAQLGGTKHVVTILGIRRQPAPPTEEAKAS